MAPLSLLSFGLSIIPCHQGTGTDDDKKPLLGWKAYQTRRATEAEVTQWERFYGSAGAGINWAIVTGIVSGIIVLDIDSAEGEELAGRLGLPMTPTVRTAHGRHVYFRHPGFAVKNFAKKLPGIDFRGDGGYVMAPGAIHPTGVIYEWETSIEDVELSDAPGWLLELIRAPEPPPTAVRPPMIDVSRYAAEGLRRELERLASAPEGARNVTLNTVAFKLGTLVGAGALERSDVETALVTVATDMGLMESERQKTLTTIARALADGIRHPRDLPREAPALVIKPTTYQPQPGAAMAPVTMDPPHVPTAAPPATNGVTHAPVVIEPEPETFSPDWSNEPPPTVPVLTLNGNRIGSKGNLSVIVAAPGHGKSAICEAITAKGLNHLADSFGIELQTSAAVIYIDTERSREDHWASWERMTRRAGFVRGEQLPPDIVFTLFAMVPTIDRRRQLLVELLAERPVGLLMLDGVGDFVLDVNDAEECNTFLAWLMATAKQREFAVLTTIHHNPQTGNEKARGHLGSEVMRRAESVLILKRDLATGQRTLTTNFEFGKVRSGADVCETYLIWDDDERMFVTTTNQTADPTPNDRHMLEAVYELFDGRYSYTYSELAAVIAERRAVSMITAKRWIGKMKKLDLILAAPDKSLIANRNSVPG